MGTEPESEWLAWKRKNQVLPDVRKEIERMIDFLLTCAAVVALLLGIVTVAGFVVTLALVIRYWRN